MPKLQSVCWLRLVSVSLCRWIKQTESLNKLGALCKLTKKTNQNKITAELVEPVLDVSIENQETSSLPQLNTLTRRHLQRRYTGVTQSYTGDARKCFIPLYLKQQAKKKHCFVVLSNIKHDLSPRNWRMLSSELTRASVCSLLVGGDRRFSPHLDPEKLRGHTHSFCCRRVQGGWEVLRYELDPSSLSVYCCHRRRRGWNTSAKDGSSCQRHGDTLTQTSGRKLNTLIWFFFSDLHRSGLSRRQRQINLFNILDYSKGCTALKLLCV